MYDRFEGARFYLSCIRDPDFTAENPQAVAKLKKYYRGLLKNIQKDDPLSVPLTSGAIRHRWGESGENLTEYCIRKGQFTPYEVGLMVDSAWMKIYSPYDCTGRLFTEGIHARQTPVGLVWIHRKGIDV